MIKAMKPEDFVRINLKEDFIIEGELYSVTDVVIILIDCRIVFPKGGFEFQEWTVVPLTSILYITPEKRPIK